MSVTGFWFKDSNWSDWLENIVKSSKIQLLVQFVHHTHMVFGFASAKSEKIQPFRKIHTSHCSASWTNQFSQLLRVTIFKGNEIHSIPDLYNVMLWAFFFFYSHEYFRIYVVIHKFESDFGNVTFFCSLNFNVF